MQEPLKQHQTLDEFLTSQRLRSFQFLHIGMGLGSVCFFFVITILYLNTPASPANDPGAETFLQQLSLATTFALATAYSGLAVMRRRIQNKTADTGVATATEISYNNRFSKFAVKRIITLALLEGPAIFGLVVCLLGSTKGLLQLFPFYWINSLPLFIFLAYLSIVFPTRDKIQEILQSP